MTTSILFAISIWLWAYAMYRQSQDFNFIQKQIQPLQDEAIRRLFENEEIVEMDEDQVPREHDQAIRDCYDLSGKITKGKEKFSPENNYSESDMIEMELNDATACYEKIDRSKLC